MDRTHHIEALFVDMARIINAVAAITDTDPNHYRAHGPQVYADRRYVITYQAPAARALTVWTGATDVIASLAMAESVINTLAFMRSPE